MNMYDKVVRERKTEDRLRKLDIMDTVDLVHDLEDEVRELEDYIERLENALAYYATDESADGWVAIEALSKGV